LRLAAEWQVWFLPESAAADFAVQAQQPVRPESSSAPAWFRLVVEWRVWSLPGSAAADFAIQAQQSVRAPFRKLPGQRWFPKRLSLRLRVRPEAPSAPAWFRLAVAADFAVQAQRPVRTSFRKLPGQHWFPK
jgi:hypothetical protein